MLTLRFKKQGAKKKYIFRLVATDSQRAANSGKLLEVLGWWNPKTDVAHLDKEKILHHLKNGAKCSEAVLNLLIKKGIQKGKKVAVHKKPRRKKEEKEPTLEVANQGKAEKPEEAAISSESLSENVDSLNETDLKNAAEVENPANV